MLRRKLRGLMVFFALAALTIALAPAAQATMVDRGEELLS